MSGHRRWSAIRGPRTPEQEARLAVGMAALRMAQRLVSLREDRGLTQSTVAERMGVSQPHIAQIEARDDVYLSTLLRYVHALGGDLRLHAVFPGEDPIEITLEPPEHEAATDAAVFPVTVSIEE